MFHHRHIYGVASLARSFSRIALKEPSSNAVLPIVALQSTNTRKQPLTGNGHGTDNLLPIRPVQLRSTVGNFEIGNSIRRNPLIPLKEIIDIPLVSRIIETPVQRPGLQGPIGDNLAVVPSLELPTDTTVKDEHGKQAARLIVIRRRKMRKHKLRKLRKRMKFEWLKLRQRRELKKEKLFQAELIGQIKEAEKFSAEAYVASKLRQATEVPLPRFWKGKRLPQFIIKQKLGLE
uniref:Small ribosomal subunit protein mS38 n=1 Tax=Anopheles funestus TaxID=62324 RepID=A0A4Y0BRV2_ANOFN